MGLTRQETRVLIEHYQTQGPLGRTATLGRNVLWISRARLASSVKSLPGGAQFISELPRRSRVLEPTAEVTSAENPRKAEGNTCTQRRPGVR